MIRNNSNYELHSFETNSGEIITVPGQSYTVKELVIRYENGVPLPKVKNMQYDEIFDEDLNPMREPDFDLTDIDKANALVESTSNKYIKYKKKKDEEIQLEKTSTDHNNDSDGNRANPPEKGD